MGEEGGLSFVEQGNIIKSAIGQQFEKNEGFAGSLLATLRDFPLTEMESAYTSLAVAAPTLPIHFIWGSADSTCPMPTKDFLLSLIPTAKVHIIENAEHDLVLSRANTFFSTVLSIINEIKKP